MHRSIAKMIRAACGCSGTSYYIEVIGGNDAPRLVGQSWRYENMSGDIIRYPSAYRRAWGKPIYIASTRRIEVGSGWVESVKGKS